MRCKKCGKELKEDARFCGYCGAPVQPEKQKKAAHITNRKMKMTARDVKTCSDYSVNLMSAR